MKRVLLPLLLTTAACTEAAPPPAPQARYVVGVPYRLGGLWFYPREDLALSETGLAIVVTDTRAGRRTANGEVHDPAGLMAAHRTMQMPAILRVTNLENGRQLLVRVNDRGPTNPGRAIELSRRAADLLGILPNQPAQVRFAVEGNLSRAAAASLPSDEPRGPRVEAIQAGTTEREVLAPLPGARVATATPVRPVAPAVPDALAAADPVLLPDQATQASAAPGRLFVVGSTFSARGVAERQAARIGAGAGVEPLASGPRADWRVRAGPFATVAEADRTLEQAHRAGVSEARILVE